MTGSTSAQPTLGQVMRRPRWIAALLLALLVAAGFAALAQWQLGSAVETQLSEQSNTEQVAPLTSVTEPAQPLGDAAAGRVLSAEGSLVQGDFVVIAQRLNQGELGYWVVGHAALDAAAASETEHLAVALAWYPTRSDASAVAEALNAAPTAGQLDFVGRYQPSEEPTVPSADEDPRDLLSLSVPQLANVWSPFTGEVYAGYVVQHELLPVLTDSATGDGPLPAPELIDSVPPIPPETINWLNLFYAIEWVVFAGFALYFWYRVAKDAWLRELELNELQSTADTQRRGQ